MNWKDNIERGCVICHVRAPSPGIPLGWHGFSVTNAAGNKGHSATCPDCSPEVLEMLFGTTPASQVMFEEATSTQRKNCPDCDAPLRAKTMGEGGGVECSADCGYWFCY